MKKMNEINQALLELINLSLNDNLHKEIDVSPEQLFAEVSRYQLCGFTSNRLDCIKGMTPATRKQWSQRALNDLQKVFLVLSAQKELTEILQPYDIKPIFLKGCASAWYYPIPTLRHIGDIDFIIQPEQHEKACAILLEKGYHPLQDSKRHAEFEKKGLEYECHRYFSYNISNKDHAVDELLYKAMENPVKRTIEGFEFYTVSDYAYGIVLLEHLRHHLYSGVGFRQICDWIVFVDKVLDDKLWEEQFSSLAQLCGLKQLAIVLTRMSQIYLGLKEEQRQWCLEAEAEDCATLLELLFASNNFLFKEEQNYSTSIIGVVNRSGFKSILTRSVHGNFPFAMRYPIFFPVLALYLTIARGFKLLFKAQDTKSLYIATKTGNKQGQLFQKLGIKN